MESQPSVRLWWSPTAQQTVWGAVSRAVRAPSRIDRDLYAPPSPPFLVAGGPNFESEILNAFELGYKVQPASTLTGSLATFYNHYDDPRRIQGPAPPFVFGHGLNGNGNCGRTRPTRQRSPPWRRDA